MIIQSIRLKNIKSYGGGPDGNGITVPFQPGVNRIAGLNGHGKTTIIECIGYALFLAEPLYWENFKIETYFLSHGAKTGEIDVTFDFKDEQYRIERGVGTQSKRRTKVVQLSDSSICAEGDKEVANFLCRLLELPEPSRLSEMFTKLIGVKQGRLAWPFDSKPTDAKKFFEPLLEVEVFRQCFDRLKPVEELFEKDRNEFKIKEGGVNERIRERSDSPEKLKDSIKAVSDQTLAVKNSVKVRDEALQKKNKQEAFEKAFNEATVNKDKAAVAAGTAKVNREEAEKRVSESEQAAVTVSASKVAYDFYKGAETALKDLDEKRKKRDHLLQKRNTAESDNRDRTGKAQAAHDQVELLLHQKQGKEGERDALTTKITPLRNELESGKITFERNQKAAEVSDADRAAIKAWVQGLPGLLKRLKLMTGDISNFGTELDAWDPAKLEMAKKAEKDASDVLMEARNLLAKARERKTTLTGQLEQISGGTCPFLKETCQQFNPAKVQADLTHSDAEIATLDQGEKAALLAQKAAQNLLTPLVTADNQLAGKRKQLDRNIGTYVVEFGSAVPTNITEAVARLHAWDADISPLPALAATADGAVVPTQVLSLQQTIDTFTREIQSWWGKTESSISKYLGQSQHEKTDRIAKEEGLKNFTVEFNKVEKEISGLGTNAEEKKLAAKKFNEDAASFKTLVESFDEQLKPYVTLDREIESAIKLRNDNKAGHESYLKAKGLADDLEPRREQLNQRKREEAEANNALKNMEDTLKIAQSSFNVENLKAARTDYERKLGEATAAETNLTHAKDALSKQQVRYREWEETCSEREKIVQEIARSNAAIDLTELARKTLRDAAPAVAQHLCDRIAARAQAVFNRINPDPAELAWDAERYSLRITPGDRRFAMLSGGEQTKLALAMTLAMVEEFSGLRFCIFDEPTYGVDADSRSKLADAILEVQKAAGLDQLLLVSHDDAFEGKVEHAILLKKSAASGTAVAQTQ